MDGGDAGLIGLCVVLAGCITWLAKRLLTALTNDLRHIKEKLDGLPCDTHAERLRQQEKLLNEVRKKGD